MKTMRSLLFTISLLVVFSSAAFCDELKVQKDEVEQVITDILYLAKEGDVKTLNERYVNKEFGIFDVYRIGVPDEFEVLDALPLRAIDWSHMPYGGFEADENKKTYQLQEVYVEFDCGEFVYDKEGAFYSKELRYPLPSNIVALHNKYDGVETYADAPLEKIKFLENNSIRVVDTSLDLIFYITKIEGKWYITLIDRVSTDCSA